MNEQQTIITLLSDGWSIRRISRELGFDRRTISKYSKCTGALTGDGGAHCAELLVNNTIEPVHSLVRSTSRCAGVLTGTTSKCLGFEAQIESGLQKGWTAQRIYRTLKQEHDFKGGYHSVQRFVSKLKAKEPKRVWRMECEPGEEAQVDYGSMRVLENDKGNLVTVHVLRVTLSHSRKSYTEAVLRQTTESFIRSLENAFRHFGGVPKRLCLDNLKAAVSKADWYEPEINAKFASFADHYGVLIMPTRPYTPEHKGKIESGIKYVQNDVLKGERFKSLAQINEALRKWESQVADLRIHGTTKQQVHAHFMEHEKTSLKPLPPELFPSFCESIRSVHRDGYVEVQKSYYHVPAEYIRQKVIVRWDAAMVRIYNVQMKPIIVHPRLEPGRYTQVLGVAGSRNSVKESVFYCRKRLSEFGEHCALWADRLIEKCPDTALRPMQGLLKLKGYTTQQINQACRKALLHGQYRLSDIRRLLCLPTEQETFTFLGEHELIRELEYYTIPNSKELFTQ